MDGQLKPARLIAALLLAFSVAASPALAASRWKAALRSAIIPGWGQWYRGQGFLGSLYFTGMAAASGYAWFQYRRGDESYSAYLRSQDETAYRRNWSDTKSADSNFTSATWALAGLYTLNLLDALLFTSGDSTPPPPPFKSGKNLSLDLNPIGPHGAELALNISL